MIARLASRLASSRLVDALAGRILGRRLLLQHGDRSQPLVALTFDDGPDELTIRYLDVLDEFSACATFFVNGDRCIRYPEALDEIVRRGHAVGLHGWAHQSFTTMSHRRWRQDLHATECAVPPTPYRLLRPPYGRISPRQAAGAWLRGYTVTWWSRDSNDAFEDEPAAILEELYERPVVAGDIVLLHEGQERTLQVLPYLLSSLACQNLETVTLPELCDVL